MYNFSKRPAFTSAEGASHGAMQHNTHRIAFTLAEVLITLGIIGIVAAMTLPALIQNYKKQEVVTRLKKFYTTLNSAFNMSVAENGDMSNWNFPTEQNNGEQMSAFVEEYLFPYFQGVKECTSSNYTESSCKKIIENLYQSVSAAEEPVYVFSDGGCFFMLPGGTNKTGGQLHVYYDINCLGKPNTAGKDLFQFVIHYERDKSFVLKPGGWWAFYMTDREDIKTKCKTNAWECAALIFFDSWEIKNDYPYKL